MRFYDRQQAVLHERRRHVAVAARCGRHCCRRFVPLAAQQAAGEGRLDAIYKIKDEGFQRSKVMEIMSWLTDVYGPRLTNSPGFRKAGELGGQGDDVVGPRQREAASPLGRSVAAGRTTSSR